MANFTWPVPGFYRVTSPFGMRAVEGKTRMHNGVDIGRNLAPAQAIDGAEIVAAESGEVAAVATNSPTMGNMVTIDHGNGFRTRYMHNRTNFAAPGQLVRRGEAIALVGSTGNSTAPHLHFEIIYRGRHLDPLKFFGRCLNGAFVPLFPIVGENKYPDTGGVSVPPPPMGGHGESKKAAGCGEALLSPFVKFLRLLWQVFCLG